MTGVASDLLGKRGRIRGHAWDAPADHWFDIVAGLVRGVGQVESTSFTLLLQVAPGYNDLDRLGMYGRLPEGALVAICTAPGFYAELLVAVVVEGT